MPYEQNGHAQDGSDLEAVEESPRFRFPFLVTSPEGLFDALRLGGRVDVVAGSDHGVADGIRLQRSGSVLYTCGFGCEADVNVGNAGNAGHRILHAPNARGTGHAGDRNLLGKERAGRIGLYRRGSRIDLRER